MNRPVLKYNGGKWLLAPWIIEQFPKHRVYVDLFGGGASVLLRKERVKYEFYNDLDHGVWNFFKVLRDEPLKLIRAIRWTPYSELEHEASKEMTGDRIKDARLFYVNCWMSMVQNKSGGSFRMRGNLGDAPGDGRYIPAKLWADLQPLKEAAERLRGVHITRRDFANVADKCDHSSTLFYVDPPYLGSTRSQTDLYNCEFRTQADHQRLIECLQGLSGMVVLSGYPVAYYEDSLERTGWRRIERATRNNYRAERTECLWLNPACQKALNQQDLFAGMSI